MGDGWRGAWLLWLRGGKGLDGDGRWEDVAGGLNAWWWWSVISCSESAWFIVLMIIIISVAARTPV